MLFLIWYIVSLSFLINICMTQQLCIDSCKFNHNFDANLILPPNCTLIQRPQCDAILTFDYSTRIIDIQFGAYSHRQLLREDVVYTSELISLTVITLEGESSTKTTVEYYCSTGDRCEYEYIAKQILPLYIHKTCHHFRANLISLLHSDPSSPSRSCALDNGEVSICDQPCQLFFHNPDEIMRRCNSLNDLEFQTTVGRTTPTNKPEYNYRLYMYTCTTELCNGHAKQQQIEKLIQSDDDECLVFLDDGNQTTTSVTTSVSPTTTSHNHAISYSKSILLCIICLLKSI